MTYVVPWSEVGSLRSWEAIQKRKDIERYVKIGATCLYVAIIISTTPVNSFAAGSIIGSDGINKFVSLVRGAARPGSIIVGSWAGLAWMFGHSAQSVDMLRNIFIGLLIVGFGPDVWNAVCDAVGV